MSFLAESIVGGITSITLGALWLASRITAREHSPLTHAQWQLVYDDAQQWISRLPPSSPAHTAAQKRRDEAAQALMSLASCQGPHR